MGEFKQLQMGRIFHSILPKWVGFFSWIWLRFAVHEKHFLNNSELSSDFFCPGLFYLWNLLNIVIKHCKSTKLILHWITKKVGTRNNCSCPTNRCIAGFKSFRENQRNMLFEKNIQDFKMPA